MMMEIIYKIFQMIQIATQRFPSESTLREGISQPTIGQDGGVVQVNTQGLKIYSDAVDASLAGDVPVALLLDQPLT